MTEIEAMGDAELARTFLLKKPVIEGPRANDLELLLPTLMARLRKEGVTRKWFIRII